MKDLVLSRFRTASIVASGVVASYYFATAEVPGGAFTGALLGSSLASSWFRVRLDIPPMLKTGARSVIGTGLGISLAAVPAWELRRWMGVGIVYVAAIILLSGLVGILYAKFRRVSIATGLVATAPGGMSEMALIAEEHDLDAAVVVLLQVVRKSMALAAVMILLNFGTT